MIEGNQDSQTKVTEFLEDNIEGYMEQHGRIIETMSSSIAPLLENNQTGEIEEKLRDIKINYPGFVNLYVGDKNGKSLVFYPSVYTDGVTREHLDFSDRSYYKELLEKNEQVISHVFHGRGERTRCSLPLSLLFSIAKVKCKGIFWVLLIYMY